MRQELGKKELEKGGTGQGRGGTREELRKREEEYGEKLVISAEEWGNTVDQWNTMGTGKGIQ
jgi:hypothetical protein